MGILFSLRTFFASSLSPTLMIIYASSLLSAKKAYAYTDGLVSTPVQTVPYTYGDSNWKDKLTKYGSKTLAYDAIGNPTSDGTWTYEWQAGPTVEEHEQEWNQRYL